MFQIPGLGDKLGQLGQLTQIASMWNDFKAKNPEVIEFMNKVNARGFCEGQELSVTVRYPDGTEYKADFTVGKDDLPVLEALGKINL